MRFHLHLKDMKKIITILCLFFPIFLSAQTIENEQETTEINQPVKKARGPHHFDVGVGLAMPGELFEMSDKESNAANIFLEYRYDIAKGFSVGALYSFVTPHPGVINMTDSTTGEVVNTIETKDNYQTLNAIAEYKSNPYGPMCFFVSLGAGAQCRYHWSSHQQSGVQDNFYWSADVSIRAGLEFFDHLRLSVGHIHDLHYPISSLNTGAPYYFAAIGWNF